MRQNNKEEAQHIFCYYLLLAKTGTLLFHNQTRVLNTAFDVES